MTTTDKGNIAEERAFEKYGGARRTYFYDTIPDIIRVNENNRLELVEVKYIDISFDPWTRIMNCIYRIGNQIKKRFECFPLGTEQRVYVLLAGINYYGVYKSEVEYAIRKAVDEITRYKYPSVYIDVEMEVDI